MKIAIIDYGMGNLHSVVKSARHALHLGYLQGTVEITSDPETIRRADKIIFPGQGAMPDCMKALEQQNLVAPLKETLENKPFFGICVGAQMLFELSEEGNTQGFGYFKGNVARFTGIDSSGNKLKVPHMGWNRVHFRAAHPLLRGIDNDSHFYFIHSYHFCPASDEHILGTSDYGHEFAAVMAKNNIFATQFHAEKSHVAGLQLLQNFMAWDGTV